jgi:hypothetical protein
MYILLWFQGFSLDEIRKSISHQITGHKSSPHGNKSYYKTIFFNYPGENPTRNLNIRSRNEVQMSHSAQLNFSTNFRSLLKRQSNEIFHFRFFHRWTPPKWLTWYLKTFRIWPWKVEIIFAIFDRLSAIIYSGESILPVVFNTENCNFPHYYGGESLFVRIICINLACSLIRRVDTYGTLHNGTLKTVSYITVR